jgi:glycosyltransferase involved in cell wall biosynthesis
MRLLQVGKYLKPVTGGIETVVYELCRGLSSKKDVKVTCLVSNAEAKTRIEKFENFHVIRAASFGTFASTPLSPSFGHFGRTIETDLIHFHLPNPLATFFFSKVKEPYVVTFHCDILRYKKLLKLYEPFLRKFLSKSRKIIVSSENLINSSPILRDFKSKCQVIPFGTDTSHLELSDFKFSRVKEMRLKYKNGFVLFVGRLVKYKGLDVLIKSIAETNADLVIVGRGQERKALEKLVNQLGITEKVHFAGFVPQEDLGIYYHACDVFALTSIDESEAFGLSLLDALACGKPLITSELSTGISQINIHGVTGFHVSVGDSKAIGQKINLLLSDNKMREEMGRNGQIHFKKSFSLGQMINSHLLLYKEILDTSK